MRAQEAPRKLMDRLVRNIGGELRKDRVATQRQMERYIRRLVSEAMRQQLRGKIRRMFDDHESDVRATLSKHAENVVTISTKIPWINKALDTISKLEGDMAAMRHNFEKIELKTRGKT